MNELEFTSQMKRLENTFGEKHFDIERLTLIRRHVFDLPIFNFARIVDHLISTMRLAPLPKDFKEAARAEKNHFQDLRAVPEIMKPDFKGDGAFQRVLERDYTGCKTLWEAVELQKFRNRVKDGRL